MAKIELEEERKKKSFFKKTGELISNESKSAFGYNQIKNNHSELKGMIEDIKSSVKPRKARTETFEEAKSRLNVSKSDLEKVKNNYAIITWISFVFSLVCIGCLIFVLTKGAAHVPVLMSLVFAVYGIASMFKYSFWVYQIKIGKLCSVKEFWNSGEFFPRIESVVRK